MSDEIDQDLGLNRVHCLDGVEMVLMVTLLWNSNCSAVILMYVSYGFDSKFTARMCCVSIQGRGRNRLTRRRKRQRLGD